VGQAVAQADAAEDVPRLVLRLGDAQALDQRRHHHVLERGELGQQVVELEHEPDPPVAELGEPAGAHRRELLADEPTGNLDRTTGQAIHELFLELNRERGSTLLVVTHNPELASLMPRRLRMVDTGHGGRLVEESETSYRGPHVEELAEGATS
jgi:predicted ABC-type transport system involved in lysophospholipase L1 biosynthesis ATPase subunit